MVVINEADSLSRDAQAALRRTMEKYTTNMRLVLCAQSTSRLIAPIRSRCLLVRVGAPSVADTAGVLRYVIARTRMATKPDEAVVEEIARAAGGNVRKAVLMFEALQMQKCVFSWRDSKGS